MVAAFTLEIKHRVDHMLDHSGAGDLTLLGHVADQNDGCAARLGVADHRLRGGADLGDGARCALDDIRPERLDGIDDDEVDRRAGGERRQDVLNLRLGGERHRGFAQAKAFRAQANLTDRLLSRHVDHAAAGLRHRGRDLDQDRRLADAGVAADEDRGSRHEATADDAVEFADAGEYARLLVRLARERRQFNGASPCATKRDGNGGGRLFGDRVPFAAGLAAALPLGGDCTAVGADELGAGAGHQAFVGGLR